MPVSSPHRYPTHILSHNHYHGMCIHVGIGTRKPLEFTVVFLYCTTFMLSSCAKVLQSLSYQGFKSTQVLHTYSVSQLLPSYVYSWRNTHPKITRIYGYMPGLHHCYDFNGHQSAAITELCRNQVHTVIPHIFCLTITCLTRASVWDLWPTKHTTKLCKWNDM